MLASIVVKIAAQRRDAAAELAMRANCCRRTRLSTRRTIKEAQKLCWHLESSAQRNTSTNAVEQHSKWGRCFCELSVPASRNTNTSPPRSPVPRLVPVMSFAVEISLLLGSGQ